MDSEYIFKQLFPTTLSGRNYYSYSADEKTEVQKGQLCHRPELIHGRAKYFEVFLAAIIELLPHTMTRRPQREFHK